MAAGTVKGSVLGFTKFGAPAGKAGGIILTDSAGNEWGLAIRQDGDVVMLDADEMNDPDLDVETDGTVIGGQS